MTGRKTAVQAANKHEVSDKGKDIKEGRRTPQRSRSPTWIRHLLCLPLALLLVLSTFQLCQTILEVNLRQMTNLATAERSAKGYRLPTRAPSLFSQQPTGFGYTKEAPDTEDPEALIVPLLGSILVPRPEDMNDGLVSVKHLVPFDKGYSHRK